jgi:membrane protease subunit HflC
MNAGKGIFALIGLLVVVVVLFNSFFIVQQDQLALRLQLGEIKDSDYEPGLHLKAPFIQNVALFDKRIQTLDTQPQRFLTVEKKFVVVDSYVKWRISDVGQYFRSTRGSLSAASRLLSDRINAALRDEFGKRTVQEVISGERTQIMETIAKKGGDKSSDIGVEIVDVRVKQIDFPEDISDSIYQRMRTERQRVASELRAQGEEEAEKIRADADRQRTEILADAYRESELIRGEGDAEAADIYASAFERDADFYSFWRSMGAYREVFGAGGSVMLLEPGSEFFRYFNNRAGGG